MLTREFEIKILLLLSQKGNKTLILLRFWPKTGCYVAPLDAFATFRPTRGSGIEPVAASALVVVPETVSCEPTEAKIEILASLNRAFFKRKIGLHFHAQKGQLPRAGKRQCLGQKVEFNK